jgi:hypothetical protein
MQIRSDAIATPLWGTVNGVGTTQITSRCAQFIDSMTESLRPGTCLRDAGTGWFMLMTETGALRTFPKEFDTIPRWTNENDPAVRTNKTSPYCTFSATNFVFACFSSESTTSYYATASSPETLGVDAAVLVSAKTRFVVQGNGIPAVRYYFPV